MGKRKNQKQPTSNFNNLAQESQEQEKRNLFKQKFPFFKQRAEECIESLRQQTFKQFVVDKNKYNVFHINSSTFSQPNSNQKSEKEYESQSWTLNSTDTLDKYYQLEDGIQTVLLENQYTRVFNIQVFQNSILHTLVAFSSLPFVKGVQIGQLTYSEPTGLVELIKNDEELKSILQDSLKLIGRMFFQRKSLEEFTLTTNGQISAESFALGIIESINADNSLRLTKLNASSLFSFLSESTTRQVLESFSLFQSLQSIDFGTIRITENDTILALNKVLALVHTAKFNIGDLRQPEKIASLHFGSHKYFELQITFSCDELRSPAAYEELFSRISEIKEVENMSLINTFILDNLEPTRATTTYKTVKDIRRIMSGSSLIEKQYNEGENKDGSDESFLPVSSFKFFEQLLKIKQTKLNFTGMISRRVVETLVFLLKNGSVTEVNLYQTQPSVYNPLNVPLQLKRVYEQEANIDFCDLYEAFKQQDLKRFTAYFRQGNISVIDNSQITINLPYLIRNKSNYPQLFDPLAFSLKTLQKLTITLGEVSDLSMYEQIFQQASECQALTFLQVNLTLDPALRKKAQYDKLHDGNKFGSEKVPQKYLSHLSTLENLKNLALNIDLDQVIIDSMVSLLHSSKSIKTLIFRRKPLSQYTLDFSQTIQALRKSEFITHSLLDFQLDQVQIALEKNKKIYNKHKETTFFSPIRDLFDDTSCKLTTLQIVIGNGKVKEVDAILKVLLKKRNNTVLVLDYYATYQSDKSTGSPVQMSMAQNLMRIDNTSQDDSQRFITRF